jgi:hypothetical protein
MYSLIFLWAVIPSFATSAPPTYYPAGPQVDVAKQTLLDNGWTMCWSSNYQDSGFAIDAVKDQCLGDYILYAGGITDSDSYMLLAAGKRDMVFTETGYDQTIEENGSFWYLNPTQSMGFSPVSSIQQGSADVQDGWGGETGWGRLSWHTGHCGEGFICNGWRVGNTVGLNSGTEYERAIWTSTGGISPSPTPLSICPPTDLVVTDDGNSIILNWSAPTCGNTQPERYAISFSTSNGGWGIATGNSGDADALKTTMTISYSLFESLQPPGTEWTFSIRSDNDSLGMYSSNSNQVTIVIGSVPEPTASPEPQPSESPSPTPAPSLSPSESPLPPVEPEPTQDPTPEPEISFPESLVPIPDESPSLDPDLPSIDLPSDNNITETTDEEINSFVEDFSQSGDISEAETEILISNFLEDGFISEDEVSGLSESLTEDGVLTEDEKELLVDVILEQADGNAISTELIDELGLDYEDLPDDQPVMLDNGVILFAEVADALEIFENPSEILGAVFTDPGKALTAVANVGADMTPEKREESQKIVVASIIAVQAVAATNLITGRIR